jgi:hypothetical protein
VERKVRKATESGKEHEMKLPDFGRVDFDFNVGFAHTTPVTGPVVNNPEYSKTRPGRKFHKVMGEYGKGTLHHGGSGKVVTNPKVAAAIAFSEQRKADRKRR